MEFLLSRQYFGPDLTVSLGYNPAAAYTTGLIPTSVTLPAGENSVKVTIRTEDDSVAEDTGELTVTVLDGVGYRPGYPSTYTFSIFDNDGHRPGVGVHAAEFWVDEGEDVVFTVTRSGSAQDPLDARLRLYRLRSRVTEADLSDPTLGITTPKDHIFFDEEEVTVSFPAGTRTFTITKSTTNDNFNYGNSSYHAIVLAGPDDDYNAYYDHRGNGVGAGRRPSDGDDHRDNHRVIRVSRSARTALGDGIFDNPTVGTCRLPWLALAIRRPPP